MNTCVVGNLPCLLHIPVWLGTGLFFVQGPPLRQWRHGELSIPITFKSYGREETRDVYVDTIGHSHFVLQFDHNMSMQVLCESAYLLLNG